MKRQHLETQLIKVHGVFAGRANITYLTERSTWSYSLALWSFAGDRDSDSDGVELFKTGVVQCFICYTGILVY